MRDTAPQSLPNRGFAELMTAVLEKGKSFRFQAAGASMSPFIRDGDILTIAPVAPGIRLGEVVAFRQPETERLAVHRVVARGKARFLIRGDNSSQADGWVGVEQILGHVRRIEHQGRLVHFGLGCERFPIAWLSRAGMLRPLVLLACRLLRAVY